MGKIRQFSGQEYYSMIDHCNEKYHRFLLNYLFFEMTTDFQKGYFVNNKTADSPAEYHLILK